MASPGGTSRLIRFASFELDLAAGELRDGAKKVRLQDQPFQILRMMLERPGEVVTRDELRQQLWPEGTFVDFEHGLNAAIKRLRVALGDDAATPRFVETVPRRGYRFVASLASSAAPGERAQPAAPLRELPRLAVLPFANLSADAVQDYFTDGLTEELIAQLGAACRGRVGIIGRWSAMTFKGTTQRAREVGEALRAGYLLEGSVRRDDERVRITVRLVEAPSETQLWSESYERELSEFNDHASGRLSVETDVAARVVRALALELVPDDNGSLVASAAALHGDLYESYLKGRYHWNNRGEEGLDDALTYFERVVNGAPAFGSGYVAISRARTALAEYYRGVPRYELERALAAAERGLSLDPGLAEAHLAIGDAHRFLKWDWPRAEAEYQRTIALNPSSENAHRSYGAMLAALGRQDEATRTAQRACELDPLCLIASLNTAWVSHVNGDYTHAVARCGHILDMEPDRVAAHRLLGAAWLQRGDRGRAIAAMDMARDVAPDDPITLTWLAHARAVSGDAAGATALLDEARGLRRYVSPYNLALGYTGLGQIDAAFRALDDARLDRDPMLANLAVEPRLITLRTDPRYASMLATLGLAAPGLAIATVSARNTDRR